MVSLLIAGMMLVAVLAVAGAYTERAKRVSRRELLQAKLDKDAADSTLLGIERTVRQNRELGPGADLLADLVIRKLDQYHAYRLKSEIKELGDG